MPLEAFFVFHLEETEFAFVDATTLPSTEIVKLDTPALALAVALRVTTPDTVAPLPGLVIVTVGGVAGGGGLFDETVSASVELVEGLLLASPPYAATMLCVPAASPAVAHGADPPESVIVHSALPSAVNCTVPVGELPVTLAMKVTVLPTWAGLSELVTAVELDAIEADDTWMVAPEVVADITVTLMPYVLSVYVLPTGKPDRLTPLLKISVSSLPELLWNGEDTRNCTPETVSNSPVGWRYSIQ